MNKVKLALIVFVLVSVLDIVGILFKIPVLVYIFKPLISLSLMALYAVSVSKLNYLYLVALVFSLLGDVFLYSLQDFYFISGLICFLVVHLIYVWINLNRLKKTNLSCIVTSITPFLIFYVFLMLFLKDHLGEMLFPVLAYGLVVSTFGIVSMLAYKITKCKKTFLMFVGAVLFIVSDSILAINIFYVTTSMLSVFIMASYIVAQFLIYKSMALDN
jgi:uncharacterized membrane protein YhhN